MNITLLCKVVDNFGDIGVVFRMAERLLFLRPDLQLNLIVDDLCSFNKINKSVEVDKEYQKVDGICVYDWNAQAVCYEDFSVNDGEKLSIILECFQCGRPKWMEKILFEDKLIRTVHIIMIDYLTAEKYAEDFHCLESLTRSAKVQKINFMPGFTDKTGGLIIDENWKEIPQRNENGNILVFTYERNWQSLVRAINQYQTKNGSKKKVMVAQGRGFDSFVDAWKTEYNSKENLVELDFLDQCEWDDLMKKCSVLFIRGEESMSRACLSGIPFVWHAYPQSDEYQLVKVRALLDRMETYFTPEGYEIIENVWIDFNKDEKDVCPQDMEIHIEKFLQHSDVLADGFRKFASDIRNNNDLCFNLMTFIEKNYIMK